MWTGEGEVEEADEEEKRGNLRERKEGKKKEE